MTTPYLCLKCKMEGAFHSLHPHTTQSASKEKDREIQMRKGALKHHPNRNSIKRKDVKKIVNNRKHWNKKYISTDDPLKKTDRME